MKKSFLTLSILLLLAMSSTAGTYADDFERIGTKNQVTLFERWIPSENGESVRELKARVTVNADIRTILDLLQDASRGKRWNGHAVDFQILPGRNPGQWLMYTRYDLPWPLNDQDCLVRYVYTSGTSQTVVRFSSVQDARFPEKADTDRMTGVLGSWTFVPAGDGRVHIIYRITTDRNHQVPRWISDKVIHSNLYDTLSAFKQQVENA